MNILKYLMQIGLSPTICESRRLVMQGAIIIDNIVITDTEYSVPIDGRTLVIQKGRLIKLQCDGVLVLADWNNQLNAWVLRDSSNQWGLRD